MIIIHQKARRLLQNSKKDKAIADSWLKTYDSTAEIVFSSNLDQLITSY